MSALDIILLILAFLAIGLYLLIVRLSFEGESSIPAFLSSIVIAIVYYGNRVEIENVLGNIDEKVLFLSVPILVAGCFGGVARDKVKLHSKSYSSQDVSKALSAPWNPSLSKAVELQCQRLEVMKKLQSKKPKDCAMSNEEYQEALKAEMRKLDNATLIQLKYHCDEMESKLEK